MEALPPLFRIPAHDFYAVGLWEYPQGLSGTPVSAIMSRNLMRVYGNIRRVFPAKAGIPA
ncbi:MAG: hypothetical protein LRY55_08365 [Leadbetterella sp.]|nr:hypothetical protein [Leadbetterella sp.]